MDAHKNFAISSVAIAPAPGVSGTTLSVTAGTATRFPATPFNASVGPAHVDALTFAENSEIVRVTNITADQFTIEREQEGTSARSIVIGYWIANSITVKSLTDIEEVANGAIPKTSESIVNSNVKKETLEGNRLANGTITPKQLQGGATPAYSGKAEIETGKEIEPSTTERKLVSLTIETEKVKETVVELVVNKVFVAKESVGAAILTNSFLNLTALVPATQKYEIKVLAGKVEKAWASVVTI